MLKKIFVDGSAGTTGLRIIERLSLRNDIELLKLTEENRKDKNKRKEMLNESDIAFLCLPDEASKEAVSMIENENTVIIDTSTAFRTNENFLYGFPEIDKNFKEKIKKIKRIAVPGCHASGFIALINPLIKNSILDFNEKLSFFSITGYSGGGKKMIEKYENKEQSLISPGLYALSQHHKHIPEILKFTGLKNEPIFNPIVANFYSGMTVCIPINLSNLKNKDIEQIKNIYKKTYNNGICFFNEKINENDFLYSDNLSGKDSMEIMLFNSKDKINLIARYDNLGKGASGAAIQCLNNVLGIDEKTGLNL